MTKGILNLTECFDSAEAGNKAVNLGALLRAGFRTPPGFVIMASALDRKEAMEEAVGWWREMGRPAVAVRSSSAAEDAGGHSMAGQHDTVLNVNTEEDLLEAIAQCRRSATNARTKAYLEKKGIVGGDVRMAVIVQKMADAKKAGVLFTADPRTGNRQTMMLEASWGLGEAVVSGAVEPDELLLDRGTGRVISARVGTKGCDGGTGCCLSSEEIHQLWKLGRRIADHFGSEQDIEWAIVDGDPLPLQARPITTLAEGVNPADEKRELLDLLDQGRGPWVMHNLGETLENPTPLTWSVMQRFMTGDGGYGSMLKLAGFEPSGRICKDGFLRLISGRVYMDLSVAGEMFFPDCPFEYDLEAVKRDPTAGQNPPTVPKGSFRRRAAFTHQLAEAHRRMKALSANYDERLKQEIIPAFIAYCTLEKRVDLKKLSPAELAERWRTAHARVMEEFAPQSLMPGLLGAMALENLRKLLEEWIWDESALKLAMELSVSEEMDQTFLAGTGLFEVGRGTMALSDWMGEHGHRGPREMELATPRWRECPDDVMAMAKNLQTPPADRHAQRVAQTRETLSRIVAGVPEKAKGKIQAAADLARRYLLYRETGKHYLMMGYDLLRDIAMEAGSRLQVGEGIFFLEQDEMLEALEVGFAPIGLIQRRMMAWKATAGARPSRVVDRAELESPGGAAAEGARGLSAGVATGTAFVARSLDEAKGMKKGDILVCPRTDPAWTPLFAIAGGLVIEQGGALSHGAIVAREMNIPAVVVSNATTRFKTGDRIVVDGNKGEATLEECGPDKKNFEIEPREIPPASGENERWWNRLALIVASGWAVLLMLFYWGDVHCCKIPSMRLMDGVLWPLVRQFGKPSAVAIIAAMSAVVVILFQRLFTDNRRLLECKRRSKALEKRAKKMPKEAPERSRLIDQALAPTFRIVLASFVPLGLLLGPLLTTFTWLGQRMDPANWNMNPGKNIDVVALIQPDYTAPIRLEVPAGLSLITDCPTEQKILPIKAYLGEQLVQWRAEKSADPLRELSIKDLEDYLINPGVANQELRWTLRTQGAAPGVYNVSLVTEDNERARIPVILGDAQAPHDVIERSDRGTIASLTIEYPGEKRVFFTPLTKMGMGWDFGWLGVYLLAYLPAMAIARWIIKPA